MTYVEAILWKSLDRLDTTEVDGEMVPVFVTPEQQTDLEQYLAHVGRDGKAVSNEDALYYSSDGKFSLRGVKFGEVNIAGDPL